MPPSCTHPGHTYAAQDKYYSGKHTFAEIEGNDLDTVPADAAAARAASAALAAPAACNWAADLSAGDAAEEFAAVDVATPKLATALALLPVSLD